jgi:hypothetical protein
LRLAALVSAEKRKGGERKEEAVGGRRAGAAQGPEGIFAIPPKHRGPAPPYHQFEFRYPPWTFLTRGPYPDVTDRRG